MAPGQGAAGDASRSPQRQPRGQEEIVEDIPLDSSVEMRTISASNVTNGADAEMKKKKGGAVTGAVANEQEDLQQTDYVIDMSAFENHQGAGAGGAPAPVGVVQGRDGQQSNVYVAGGIVGAPIHVMSASGRRNMAPIYTKTVSE